LSYQWQLSTDGGTTFNNVGGATASSYTTPSTVAGDSGKQYRVIVSGACAPAATSTAATLTVNTASAISTQPTAHSACSGSSTTFSVTATGGSLTYQWRKDAVNLSNGGNISGATTATPTRHTACPGHCPPPT